MLDYVCTTYFEGQSDQVKGYNIAVEALGVRLISIGNATPSSGWKPTACGSD
jgi:hypothetical protein